MNAHIWELKKTYKNKRGTKYSVYQCKNCGITLDDEADCEGEKK